MVVAKVVPVVAVKAAQAAVAKAQAGAVALEDAAKATVAVGRVEPAIHRVVVAATHLPSDCADKKSGV